MFSAKILCDSEFHGSRITTCELTYPRCIHSEFMTHRMFSRNAASSRAIPVEKMLKRVKEHAFIPTHWGVNQKGMQAENQFTGKDAESCEEIWLQARDSAVSSVESLLAIGLHKQIANRLLEPWMWITVICTGNNVAYENFFKLRCHPDAEPHIQKLAYLLRDRYDLSCPKLLKEGEWHLPLTGFEGDEHLLELDLPKVSTARCARVSYLTHDGRRDIQADIDLHDKLKSSGHWSPFEHVACAKYVTYDGVSAGGNLGNNWQQYRKNFVGECCHKASR